MQTNKIDKEEVLSKEKTKKKKNKKPNIFTKFRDMNGDDKLKVCMAGLFIAIALFCVIGYACMVIQTLN